MKLLIAMALAIAGEAGPEDARPAVPPPTERAREPVNGETLFHSGVAAYDRRDYHKAIELFERAYQETHLPAILFDVAQAYHALGDCQGSLETLDWFLEIAPADDPLRPRARGRKAELGACPETGASPKPPVTPVPPPATPARGVPAAALIAAPAADINAPPHAPTRFVDTTWGRTCFAAGTTSATLGAVGLTLGLEARAIAGTVEQSQTWSLDVQRSDARGRSLADTSEMLLLGASLAAVVTGLTCWFGWRETRSGGRPAVGSNGR